MARSACYLCGHTLDLEPGGDDFVVRIPDYESSLGEFDVVKCRRCALGHTNPYPTAETAGVLYSTKQSADFDLITGSVIDQIKDRLARRLAAKLGRETVVRSVLDFSTGNGRFALAAAEVFPDAKVDAVDFQNEPPPALQDESRVQYLTMDAFSTSHESYDVIILRHVLEHTHDPVALVASLGAHLTPRGILYIEVPNLDSTCAKSFRDKWPGFYVPRHIFHYTQASLAAIIARAGMEYRLGRTEMPLMGNVLAIALRRKSNLPIKVAGVALQPAQIAVERVTGSSTCITAICRRRRTGTSPDSA